MRLTVRGRDGGDDEPAELDPSQISPLTPASQLAKDNRQLVRLVVEKVLFGQRSGAGQSLIIYEVEDRATLMLGNPIRSRFVVAAEGVKGKIFLELGFRLSPEMTDLSGINPVPPQFVAEISRRYRGHGVCAAGTATSRGPRERVCSLTLLKDNPSLVLNPWPVLHTERI
jgi:hypothetical protein